MQKATRRSARMAPAPPARKPESERTFIEQARRRQILAAASELFRTRGFNSTSLDDIAAKVGVSRGVLFYHFDGKREIGEQVVRQSMRGYSEYVRVRVQQKRTSRTQLLEFVDACLDYQKDHREIYLLYVDLLGCLGDMDEKYALTVSMNRRTRAWLQDLIEAGQRNGEIATVPAAHLADVIQGFIDGLMEMSALDPDTVHVDGCKQLIRRMLLGVIGP